MQNDQQFDHDYFGAQHLTVIKPGHGWSGFDLSELWAYRELLWVLTQRDIKVRYKQTVLGILWAVIQPVMAMVVFTIFFGNLAKIPSDGHAYPVFVYAALLPWMFFANAVSSASSSVIGSSNLVSKVYFPRLIIPLSSVGAGVIDFMLSAVVLLLLMLYYGAGWTLHLLFAPVLLLAVIFIALGVGTLLAALHVAYRDFRYVIPYLIQLWMFATPVVYPASLVPEQWKWLLYLNPMAGLIEGFRSVFLGNPFDIQGLMISSVTAIIIFICGVAYFERVKRRFADII